MTSRHP